MHWIAFVTPKKLPACFASGWRYQTACGWNQEMNIVELLSRQAAERSEAAALVLLDKTVSYGALDTLVWKATTKPHRIGIRTGDVVAISFENQLAALIAMLATERIGATVFPLPPNTPAA